MATCDRSGNNDFKVVTRRRINKKDLDKVFSGKLDKATVLCVYAHRSYTAFIKGRDIIHKKFAASKGQWVVENVYLVQNLNNMDMLLKKFMEPFNVVGSKYL